MTASTPENVTPTSAPTGKTAKSQSGKTTSSNDGNTLLVAIVDPTAVLSSTSTASTSGRHDEVYTPLRLACPRTNQVKDYLQLQLQLQLSTHFNHNTILELQALDDESTSTSKQYSSWFVGNTVVSNGKLYLLTRVDPLFFVVAKAPVVGVADVNKTKSKWQPLDQLLQELQVAEPIQRLLLLLGDSTTTPSQTQSQDQSQLQLLHLCESYEIDDDETFYKFSHTKTLAWLQKKQAAVYAVLLQQLVQEAQRKATQTTKGGAVCEGFTLPTNSSWRGSTASTSTAITNDTPDKNGNKFDKDPHSKSKTGPTPQQHEQATRESIQIVCNYLSPPWQTAFLNHLNQPPSVLKPAGDFETHNNKLETPNNTLKTQQQENRIRANAAAAREEAFHAYVTTATTIHATTNMVTPAPPPPQPKLSFGQKQLLKVNKKGMKPMTSFFAPKAAKK